MTLPFRDEIIPNMERARESIRAARALADDGYYDFAASRAYYAAFYAATAVLLQEGREFSKHSSVIAANQTLERQINPILTDFMKQRRQMI